MHRGHQAIDDAEVVVEHLGDRCQAIGGAAGIGNHVLARVAAVVHAHHEHWCGVLGGSAHHHTLGAGIDVGAGGVVGEEKACAFEHVVGANLAPLEVVWISLGADTDHLAIHHQLSVFDGHLTLEAAMGGVVTEHVGQVVDLDKVVNTNDLHVRQGHGTAEGKAADAAETVNADANGHGGAP